MKSYKFLLFAFVLLLFTTPVFATFDFDDDLPDKENSTKVILVVDQERIQNEDFASPSDYLSPISYSYFERNEPKIYNDAIDLHHQYHLTNHTKSITVKDMSRIKNPFRFLFKSNRIFIASNLQSDSRNRA
ncbi:hypothetical protein ACE193_21565 [Bernardetia sp. OM2101]|uniref:hypothetical protein n=1 Tax=Bernardetia sp. OM2101 TaxID=3344876 RepID=UPI0035CEE327